jgi:hypothetical protein
MTAAASYMCLALGLNSKKYNNTPEDQEQRGTFQMCYTMEHGIAMALSRSSCLHDIDIDEDIFLCHPHELEGGLQVDINYVNLDLARLQCRISSELRSPQSQADSSITRRQKIQALKTQADFLFEKLVQVIFFQIFSSSG